MGIIARRILRGASSLMAGAVFGFIGYHIGQVLRGSPAATFALALGAIAIGRDLVVSIPEEAKTSRCTRGRHRTLADTRWHSVGQDEH